MIVKNLILLTVATAFLAACDQKQPVYNSELKDRDLTFINKVNINIPVDKKCGKESCDGDVQHDN